MTQDFEAVRLLADHGRGWSDLVLRAVALLANAHRLMLSLIAVVVSTAFIAVAVMPGQVALGAAVSTVVA